MRGTSRPARLVRKLADPSSLVTSCDLGRRRCCSVIRARGRRVGVDGAHHFGCDCHRRSGCRCL
jgi:hypothetical protein